MNNYMNQPMQPNSSTWNNMWQNPYNNLQNINYLQSQNSSINVTIVNGKNGAEAYNLPPNSSALLLDEGGLLVWLVKTDGAGYKTVSCYDITPHQDQPPLTYNDFEILNNRISQLENQIGGFINGNTANPTTTIADISTSASANTKPVVIKQS